MNEIGLLVTEVFWNTVYGASLTVHITTASMFPTEVPTVVTRAFPHEWAWYVGRQRWRKNSTRIQLHPSIGPIPG